MGPRVAALLLLVAVARPAAAADLLVRDARLIDGTGAAPHTVSILIRGGRIAEIGPALAADGVPVLDAGGATVVPGLVDAHVHLRAVPGGGQRHDPAALALELRHQHLRAFLACGVTTVLDTAIDVPNAREIQAWLATGHPGPTVLMLGPPIAAPGGYMAAGYPESVVATPADLPAAFDAIASVGGVGVKVPIERGFGPVAVWPIHTPAMREAIVREAAARRLPIYVHATDEEEQSIGLDMGAHTLVHTSFYGADPSPAFVERLARSGAYVATTFSIMDAGLVRWHPERLDDPVVRLVVPEIERATARDPASGTKLSQTEMAMAFPALPAFVQRFLAWAFASEAETQRCLASCLRAAKRFHEAGVPLVVGSDAPNWEVIPYHFLGPSTLRELELLGEAGVAPADVLAAATRVPAGMLGITADAGTVEVGKRGDLVVLAEDPLVSPRAFRTIRWTVKDGVARTPEGWMGR